MRFEYKLLLLSALVWLLAPALGHSEEKKDPYLRDDDISRTSVSVDTRLNAQGLYVYLYDLQMPASNTGQLRSFVLDIGCAEKVDLRGFDPADFPSDADRSFSRDGRHVPVAIDAPWGQSGMFGIGEGNAVHWGVVGEPGTEKRGLQLISPYPPGAREYQLVPNMRFREEEYDYSGLEEDDETVPWTDEMTVAGMTAGPACPGEEYPDGIPGETRFPGSAFAGQTDPLNELLTYSVPLRDQFHLPAGSRELELRIHYGETIDPKTFRVTPEKRGLRRLFNPVPGSSETVRLPLEPGKNRIELQVQAGFTPPGRQAAAARPVARRGGVAMDRDVFVVRVDAENGNPGKGANKRQVGQ